MMNLAKLLGVITGIEVLLSATSGLLFVVAYQIRARWWTSPIGRHMMSFMAGLELILLLAVISRFWPNMPGKEFLRVGSWFIVFVMFTWRTVLMISSTKHASENLTDEQIDAEIERLRRLKG